MGQPRPLFCLFSVFFKQTIQYLFSIQHRDSNPQPRKHESYPITTTRQAKVSDPICNWHQVKPHHKINLKLTLH